MSSSQKPLPALPRRPADSALTTLTLEAKAHLSRFIRHSFEEDRPAFSESKSEAWAVVLEDVLDELGVCVTRGGWLTGIKRARMCMKTRKDIESRKAEEERTKKEKNGSETSRGRQRRTGLFAEEEASEHDQEAKKSGSASQARTSDTTGLALAQIRQLVAHPAAPTPKPSAKHLILSVVPLGSGFNIPRHDNVSDHLSSNIGCVFSAGTFFIPVAERSVESIILYGLHEWEAGTVRGFSSNGEAVNLVGGTFSFKGVNSAVEHQILFKVLRLAIYVHLSLLLEQHFLADSNVELRFPKPRSSPSILSFPMSPTSDRQNEERSKKTSFLPLGFLSFFSKKTGTPVHRATTISPVVGRAGSLDLGAPRIAQGPRSSDDINSNRFRTFSFLPDNPFLKSAQEKDDVDPPFAATLKRIEKSREFLSTSAGMSFPPPTLLAALAEQEHKEPSRRLKGDERVGLTSILGWDGKDARGKGMSGTLGFIRQQTFSVLYSRHVPSSHTASSSTTSDTSSLSSRRTSTSSCSTPVPTFSTCDQPCWKTYRYYSRDEGKDMSLGETIIDLVSGSQSSCDFAGCQFKRREHELRLAHGGSRIVVNVHALEPGDIDEGSNVNMWESCRVCGARTSRSQMSDGTYLFSFAKFLEVLIYSPVVYILTPALCEHTTPPSRPCPPADIPLPRSRFNIIRHFSHQSSVVSFTLSAVDDIFELCVPRLQIIRGGDRALERRASSSRLGRRAELNEDDDKKVLRREMMEWWSGLSDHMDKIEETFAGDNLVAVRKALPRLPSADEDYEEIDYPITPKASIFLPRSRPNSPSHENTPDGLATHDASSDFTPRPAPILPKSSDPAQLLSSLRHTFQRTEQSLYAQLSKIPVSSLNDVRREFISAARGAGGRLSAWQNKHMVKGHVVDESLNVNEPEWWVKGCHAVPGGNIIVREDDWGSIIAFTLSSADYHQELANISLGRRQNSDFLAPPILSPTPTSPSSATFTSSFFANKLFTLPVPSHPDPDLDDIVWHEPEPCSAVISRKQHPRDSTLLSIRDVLRQKHPVDGTSGLPFGGLTRGLSGSGARDMVTPPSAWAKPAVEVSKQAADGEVSGPVIVESVGTMLQEMEAAAGDSSGPCSSFSGHASSSAFHTNIRRSKPASIISIESDETIGPENDSISHLPPTPPPKNEEPAQQRYSPSSEQTSSTQPNGPNPTNSSITTSLTGGITNAVRYMFNSETPRPPSPFSRKHHLLTIDPVNIDDRPHIKYDWTIGKRLKFSCTAYYAKQFDVLRRRCGIDEMFLKSLGRSMNWAAQGGKSKSNFWKTSDDQFIIKTLVNAWNVADLQVLIELAPSYFRYMDATASRATVLAKLLGFYTVEIRNLETGAIQAKADLLVTENLFYEQKVEKTFDLKGIQGRRVKPGSSGTSTRDSKILFDGDWIEGQQRTLMLVRPHSKAILREAIKNDSNFLAQSNIMDYSLLLGVNEEKRQIACGLVDTIGSYTFAKTLEYKAKHGLKAGKDVTVVPPTEYQERFVTALDRYFLACPDKWSRPSDDKVVISDSNLLPSVL